MSLRTLLLFAIGVLYVVSVPWYRTPGEAPSVWWGLPDWVAVSVGCYVAVAVLNAAAWLLTDVPDAEPEEESGLTSQAGVGRAGAGEVGAGEGRS